MNLQVACYLRATFRNASSHERAVSDWCLGGTLFAQDASAAGPSRTRRKARSQLAWISALDSKRGEAVLTAGSTKVV
jgi:hypothetical protein